MASILGKRKASKWTYSGRVMGFRRPPALKYKKRGGYRLKSSMHGKNLGGVSRNRMVWHGNGCIPQRYDCVMQYGYPWKYTTVGGFDDWVIRANSIYDPDVSLGGDQCAGLDQLKNLWLNYKVSASYIEVTVVNNDTDDPVYVTIVPELYSNAIGVANKNSVGSQSYAKTITVANQAGQAKVSNFMSSKVMFGVTNLDSVNFQALTNANPATLWYWHTVIWNNSGNALNCEVIMKIRFYTEFSGLSYLDQ